MEINPFMQTYIDKFKEQGHELQFHDTVTEERQSSYWYSGNVASLNLPDGRALMIAAQGEIRCTYYDKDEEIYVKDKNLSGNFYHELSDYIKDDEDLHSIIGATGERRLEIDNNNWWECFGYEADDSVIDAMFNLDEDKIGEALDDLLKSVEDYKESVFS